MTVLALSKCYFFILIFLFWKELAFLSARIFFFFFFFFCPKIRQVLVQLIFLVWEGWEMLWNSPIPKNLDALNKTVLALWSPRCIRPILLLQFSSVQLLSRVRLFVTLWTAACQASLSINNSRSPPKPMFIESVMPSNHLILHRPLLLLLSIFPSIRVFSNESSLRIKWPKYWSFSFNISSSNEHPGLIFFRMDLLDLLAVQGTLKSLLQHHSSKASILRCSAFFIV